MTGDRPSLGELYDAHASVLFGFVLNLTRNEGETEDVLQDVFCTLAERPQVLDGVRDPRAFLVCLAHRRVIDRMRRAKVRHPEGEALELFAPGRDPDEAAFRAVLADALEMLPDEQRAVVHLKLWGGLTFEEIAEALEIPANTAASRYRYGLDKLRDVLRPIYEEIR